MAIKIQFSGFNCFSIPAAQPAGQVAVVEHGGHGRRYPGATLPALDGRAVRVCAPAATYPRHTGRHYFHLCGGE